MVRLCHNQHKITMSPCHLHGYISRPFSEKRHQIQRPTVFARRKFGLVNLSTAASELGPNREELSASICFPLCPRTRKLLDAVGMSQTGHVWTAPGWQEESSL